MHTIKPLTPVAIAATFLLLLWHSPVQAQNSLPPKPFMWITKARGEGRNNHFDSLKLAAFSTATGVIQRPAYHLGNFLGMIQYFHSHYGSAFTWLDVYLAIYDSTQPAGRANRLTLIFAPYSDAGNNTLGWYHLADSTTFDSSSAAQFQVDSTLAGAWRSHYAALMPLATLSDTDRDNRYHGQLSDTRSVRYCAGDLDTLIVEQQRTHYTLNGSTPMLFTTNFIVHFGAYDHPRANYNNRTVLTFNWTDPRGRIVYLEDTYHFNLRPAGKSACHFNGSIQPFDIDNGLLCPANCPN